MARAKAMQARTVGGEDSPPAKAEKRQSGAALSLGAWVAVLGSFGYF